MLLLSEKIFFEFDSMEVFFHVWTLVYRIVDLWNNWSIGLRCFEGQNSNSMLSKDISLSGRVCLHSLAIEMVGEVVEFGGVRIVRDVGIFCICWKYSVKFCPLWSICWVCEFFWWVTSGGVSWRWYRGQRKHETIDIYIRQKGMDYIVKFGEFCLTYAVQSKVP